MEEQSVIAVVFPKDVDQAQFANITARAKDAMGGVPGVRVHLATDGAAETIIFFLQNGELPVDESLEPDGSLGPGIFSKKPVEVRAVQVRWSNWSEICDFFTAHGGENIEGYNITEDEVSDTCGEPGPEYIAFKVMTTHGEEAVVRHGDWLIPDSTYGTFYPCKPDVFKASYKQVRTPS